MSSALAVGFLMTPFLAPVGRSYLALCGFVLLVQAAVGLVGFWLHTGANLHGPSGSWWNNFIYGAPALAPLLFPNLVVLAGMGLWILARKTDSSPAA